MSLHDSLKLPDIWETLYRVKQTLDFSDLEFADRLRLTQNQYLQAKNKTAPSMYNIEALTEELGIDFEILIKGKIDYRALLARWNGNKQYIPEYYQLGAFSKKRTSMNILGYLETIHGWALKDRVLRHFQMHESAFLNPEDTISVNFVSDLTAHLAKWGFQDQDLVNMGRFSVIMNKGSIGKDLVDCRRPEDIFEKIIFELSSRFDKNSIYDFKSFRKHTCIISATPNKDLYDILKIKTLGNVHTCASRKGVISSFPGYLDLQDANVKEVSCIHKGDQSCDYLIDFSAAAKQHAFKPHATFHQPTVH